MDPTDARVTASDTVRLERILPALPERVWDYLTKSELRRKWLASGEMAPFAGGKVEHLFRHHELSSEATPARFAAMTDSPAMAGEVTAWDPPRTLAYTWPGDGGQSEVTFELAQEGRGTRLVVTHRRLAARGTRVMVATGWGAHLAILADVLSDEEPRGFWSEFARLEAINERELPR